MIDRMEVLEYALSNGNESAANLLLLVGPDGYLQGKANYDDLMYHLTNGQEGKPIEI